MKRRSESYFGLHFDFHASPAGCPAPIGETLKEEDIREICTLLHPDFLQIDCKGHPGWCSYPTKVGNAMPEFKGDPLALWRSVTKKEDVALYLHYSGVIDNKYCAEHPDEAVMNSDGSRSTSATRTNGAYVDSILIPQLTEAADVYGVDGAWVDGDCWGSQLDFDPKTVAAFEQETGISLNGQFPSTPDVPYFDEYREYCRELFRRYVRHYVDALHKNHPGFQVASNWSYSDHMPEAITADVDFISGDLAPVNSFNSARYAGRAIASQNYTWDLMSWNFRSENGFYATKHPLQVMQEAAAVISLGGGFQNYITQQRDGSPRMEQIRRMKPLADFMRARQEFCFRGHARHQVALLLSTFDRHKESASLFSRNGCEKIMGLTALLCDIGQSVEVVSEHTLSGHYTEYPVIVVPELFAGLDNGFIGELLTYARNGGSLLLVGAHTCEIFSNAGASLTVGEKTDTMQSFTLDHVDFGSVYGSRALTADGKCVAEFDNGDTLAAVIDYGKGKLAAIGADFGSAYQSHAEWLHTAVVKQILDILYVPSVRLLSCEGTLEITDLIKDGKQMIQLVNANGEHRNPNVATEDRLLPCFDISLSIEAKEKPKKLLLQPEGTVLPFTWDKGKGRATVAVQRVDLHEIVEVVR